MAEAAEVVATAVAAVEVEGEADEAEDLHPPTQLPSAVVAAGREMCLRCPESEIHSVRYSRRP